MSANDSTKPTQERDASLLAVGKQCSDPGCLLVDFLPFKCQHCRRSFCQEHFKVNAHRCPEYDESKHNRVAPNCPLCNTPVAVRPGQDPNVRMDDHLERECSVVTGKVKAKTTPVCTHISCKKVLFSPIRCTSCRQMFCPAHRFPSDHSCSAPSTSNSKPGNVNKPFNSISIGAQNVNKKVVTAGNAALDAVKSSIAAASTSASIPQTPVKSKAPSAPPVVPFRSVDRRARAERESRLKAMQVRKQKGLLTEDEKAFLAAEEAAAKDRKECIIM